MRTIEIKVYFITYREEHYFDLKHFDLNDFNLDLKSIYSRMILILQGENQNHIILANLQISDVEYIFFIFFKIIVFKFHV